MECVMVFVSRHGSKVKEYFVNYHSGFDSSAKFANAKPCL